MPSARVAVTVRIQGRVQGVGYRAWVDRTARELSLAGWVRNRQDGSVEAEFEGPKSQIDDMLARCWKGPNQAKVTSVEAVSAPVEGAARKGFLVRATL